jgi:hypothetical protein
MFDGTLIQVGRKSQVSEFMLQNSSLPEVLLPLLGFYN